MKSDYKIDKSCSFVTAKAALDYDWEFGRGRGRGHKRSKKGLKN